MGISGCIWQPSATWANSVTDSSSWELFFMLPVSRKQERGYILWMPKPLARCGEIFSFKFLGRRSWLVGWILKDRTFLSDYSSFPCFSLPPNPLSCNCVLSQYSSLTASSHFSLSFVAQCSLQFPGSLLVQLCLGWCLLSPAFSSIILDYLMSLSNLQVSCYLLITPDVRLLPQLVAHLPLCLPF